MNLRDKGVPGVLDPEGEPGVDPGSSDRFLKPELLLRIVMLLVIVTLLLLVSTTGSGDDRVTENESYFRSFPRPVSGRGPASVSSQSLFRSPIIDMNNSSLLT